MSPSSVQSYHYFSTPLRMGIVVVPDFVWTENKILAAIC